jgi:hypothetical protein
LECLHLSQDFEMSEMESDIENYIIFSIKVFKFLLDFKIF